MRRVASLLAATATALTLGAAPAGAQGVDQTCLLVLTKFDPGTTNVAFPDDSAAYWVGAYQALPGTRIRLHGEFPHARYMSFNVYDQAQRPLDAIADAEIEPDPGATNPFRAGADRTAARRGYTAFVDFGPIPSQRKPNTLYTGTGQGGAPNLNGTFIYRTYIADAGYGEDGGAGLPTATIEPESASGQPDSPCRTIVKPSTSVLNDTVAAMEGYPSGPGALPPIFDRPVPRWRKFTNIFAGVADNLTDSDLADPLFQLQRSLDLHSAGGSGGFLSNLHNAYMQTGLNKVHGAVVVTRMRMPTFPDTRAGTATMPGGQLRYWSLCSNDPATQRFVGCINDDRAVIGPDGYATFVVSSPANKPRCAGVNWLAFGPNARSVLIYRHMLPEPGFPQSIQRATFEQESLTMGEYVPRSKYFLSKAAAELAGCR